MHAVNLSPPLAFPVHTLYIRPLSREEIPAAV